jgi:hypothetical protein
MNLVNYDILEQIRLYTNTHALKLRCKKSHEIVFVLRGHIQEGQISQQRYYEIREQYL